ncbi:FAD-dependent oxidoreductase [Pseudonocardia sp. N23]|uniref:FAD-dependent oxidoreductase n=1 Tax=Pseudonocardia sp. N23 TaxID=1987376 RepID=UPI000BFE5A2C|nr:FAD-dependent oxidoreductase [Pseudonocardia sp. N23]GAY09837.1 salicylate hydroxylase [Pseudonocardia sp. N23]
MNDGFDPEVVVAGGGPGGMVTAYLLARSGVRVTLLESHRDFDRDFRGDSLHPWTLELLDSLGLAGDLLALPHFAARWFRFHTPHGTIRTTDYGGLPTPYNYVALMPQSRFLDFMAARAAELPGFELRLGAKVTGLLVDGETPDGAPEVTGVRYRDAASGAERELRARLVVGADGRFSRMRRLAGLTAEPLGARSDLLWFRLPRHDDDPPEADVDLYFGRHHYVGLLGGPTDWQIGYSLPKGGYPAVRDAGVEPIHRFVAEHVPWLADRVEKLTSMDDTTLLSVDISRVATWWRPGLLLIGDAAHVISPVGGNGILMAVQDAVAATNRLVPALRAGRVGPDVLAAIQADREPAIQVVQAQQVRTEKRVAKARERGRPMSPPAILRLVTALPGFRVRAARRNAYGPNPPALDVSLLVTRAQSSDSAA